ncbi:hypothetical protein [Streptomyces sp. KHY 26]|uniref:hypothetical protein n=1 Tax=Streptomyces sp. KHY 26 TaxID=3097359 RepID=UPI00376EDCC7
MSAQAGQLSGGGISSSAACESFLRRRPRTNRMTVCGTITAWCTIDSPSVQALPGPSTVTTAGSRSAPVNAPAPLSVRHRTTWA